MSKGNERAVKNSPVIIPFRALLILVLLLCKPFLVNRRVGLLIQKITVYQSFIKYIKAGRIEISEMELWERVGKLVEQIGIKGSVGLYTNSLISSPLLIGFFRPCVMLPTTELSCDEAVIKSLDASGRRAYGDTLLNAMGKGGNYKEAFASIYIKWGASNY